MVISIERLSALLLMASFRSALQARPVKEEGLHHYMLSRLIQ